MEGSIIVLLNKKNVSPSFGHLILAEEFRKKGFKTHVLEALSPDFESDLNKIFESEKVLFVLSHNNLKADYKIDGEYFYDKYGCYYITPTDTPLNKFEIFKNTGKNVIFLLADKSIHDLVRPVIGNKGLYEWVSYNNVIIEEKIIPFKEREIDVLFAARIGSADKKLEVYPPSARKLAAAIVDKYSFQYEKQVHELVWEEINTIPFFRRFFYKRFFESNDYNWRFYWDIVHLMRTRRRNFVLDELLTLPDHFKITVITDKDNVDVIQKLGRKNITVHEFMPWPDVIKMMQNSKSTLNIFPYHIYNHHERIAVAQYSRSVIFSDKNKYLEKEFVNEEDIILYDYKKGHLCSELIKFLPNEEKMTFIAENAYKKVQQQYMPAHQAEFILNTFRKHTDKMK